MTPIRGTLAFGSILLLLWATSGCEEIADYFSSISFIDVSAQRTKLINGVESYQSIEEARRMFPVWEVVEQSSLGPKDNRPPFSIYKVSIKRYSHLGIWGELHLEFFNNRLMETWFYPGSFDKYVDLLEKKEGLGLKEERDGLRGTIVSPYTHIWIYKDYKGRNYVAWEDTRLRREQRIWIKRYS
ncbi:MAG: hypothetical protein ACRD2L_08825 [Terriglobia bacterium]